MSLYSNTDTFSNDFVKLMRWLTGHRSVVEKTPERVGTGSADTKKVSSGSAVKFSQIFLRIIWEVRGGVWSPGKAGATYGESQRHDL